jgi:hypothetical protein
MSLIRVGELGRPPSASHPVSLPRFPLICLHVYIGLEEVVFHVCLEGSDLNIGWCFTVFFFGTSL